MTVVLQGLLSCMVRLVVMLSLRYLPLHYSSRSLTAFCVADRTGHYIRRLLEPALSTVPLAADVPSLFQSALYCSGTLPFPVPDVFYESQKRQDDDMKYYLAPVSHSGAVAFSSTIHAVLLKKFPAGSEMVQAGWFLTFMFILLACAILWAVLCASLSH